MERLGSYRLKKFSKNRRNITLLLSESARKHSIHTLLEIDVTDARRSIHDYKQRTGKPLSFTGWIVYCVARAVSEHPNLNAYRHGERKMIEFDDVDVPIPVERMTNEEQRPMVYIIRKANEKNVLDITDEIRKVQSEVVNETTQLLGGNLTRFERLALGAPMWLKKLLLLILRRNAFIRKEHMGTVGVTSIGMYGQFPGWVIPLGVPAILIVVGGVVKKPGVVGNEIKIREILHLTITVDHDMVDGGPLARFVSRFSELLENAYGLEIL